MIPARARWLAVAVLALGAAGALTVMYSRHRSDIAEAAEHEAPVVAPSRVKSVDGRTVVVLDSTDVDRIALATAPVGRAPAFAETALAGEIVAEPERVSVLRAPISGRLVLPPGARWPRFGERIARGAPVAQVSDGRPLTAMLTGIVTRVGARPGEIVAAGELLVEITDNSRPVVRVARDAAVSNPPNRVTVRASDGGARVGARLIGPASEADPVTRRPAFLYRAERGWPGATPGAPVTVLVSAGRAVGDGALIPQSAAVQWEGLVWAYAQRGPGRYERVRVPTDRPAPDAWIAGPPWTTRDTVVVTGAQELLSEEFRARVTVGDEAGE